MIVNVSTRAAKPKCEGVVLIELPDGLVELAPVEARELSRAILSAATAVEHGDRATVARATVTTARQLRRSTKVDESLRGLDD